MGGAERLRACWELARYTGVVRSRPRPAMEAFGRRLGGSFLLASMRSLSRAVLAHGRRSEVSIYRRLRLHSRGYVCEVDEEMDERKKNHASTYCPSGDPLLLTPLSITRS